jgi:hypothetical protein
MGDFAEDLINDFSHEFPDKKPMIWIPLEIKYEVRIIHRRTGECEWSGEVTASSKKDAQREFRKKYAHIRSQYTHEYGLGISRI